MRSIKPEKLILFATDLKGVAIADLENGTNSFIHYPEAAIWTVLMENRGIENSLLMLQAILGRNEHDSLLFIDQSLRNWERLKFILKSEH